MILFEYLAKGDLLKFLVSLRQRYVLQQNTILKKTIKYLTLLGKVKMLTNLSLQCC